MAYVTSEGIRIHYEIEGDGPPLVLVDAHGQAPTTNWADGGAGIDVHPGRVLRVAEMIAAEGRAQGTRAIKAVRTASVPVSSDTG